MSSRRPPLSPHLPASAEGGAGFGTFGGVFTPSILTILGVIMYLRFGWVVGNVGLLGALAVVTLATSITFLTALSISSIATDRRVRVGGAYYMISRSLGIETGGAIGIPLYFAQALSVALYTIGFAESVVEVVPTLSLRTVGIVTTVAVAALALWSARLAIQSQYVIMAVIALSLISFVLGQPIEATSVELTGAPPHLSEGFWRVFAVFFPAVTGIMAGVNMSGDLKDPQRSIPRGTLAAVGTGYLIYMALPIFLAGRADATTLIEDPLVMRRIAIWGDAILLGVWGATLSSAMGSLLGAPRVLQALARDGIFPAALRFLGKGSGPNDEPRYGTAITLAIALAAVSLGDLNMIAPVLTMFFLTTYLVLNVAAGVEGFLRSPSFRPSFRVPWILSLLGAVGCLGVMFLINPVATIVAALVVLAVYLWLGRRELEATWGDVRKGVWMAIVRAGIFQMERAPEAKTWRPNLLVLSGAPTRRWNLIELANSLTHDRGLVTVSTILPAGSTDARRRDKMEGLIGEFLNRHGVQALVRTVSASDPFEGGKHLVDSYGLGVLVPNTILLGDSKESAARERFADLIHHCYSARRNVLVLRDRPGADFGNRAVIDVWWGGLQANGGLMMILAYLLRTEVSWRGARIRMKLVVGNEQAAERAQANLRELVGKLRLGAETEVIVDRGRSFPEILRASSADADMVMLGMAKPGDDFAAYYEKMQETSRDLPTTLLVLAADGVDFSEVLL